MQVGHLTWLGHSTQDYKYSCKHVQVGHLTWLGHMQLVGYKSIEISSQHVQVRHLTWLGHMQLVYSTQDYKYSCRLQIN
jgi:hypothetical protein